MSGGRPLACFFTDFGEAGPYTGLMELALLEACPEARVVRLLSDAPAFEPLAAGVLLAALLPWLPPRCALVGVVDPGVGGDRRPLLLELDGRLLVGPDNGLFAPAVARSKRVRVQEIDTAAFRLSASFHGRDLFAPAAGRWLAGRSVEGRPLAPEALEGHGLPAEQWRVIYIDRYGNAMTGILGDRLEPDRRLLAGGRVLGCARTFSDVAPGEAFWYVNSLGLVELAVNRGRADEALGLVVGSPVRAA